MYTFSCVKVLVRGLPYCRETSKINIIETRDCSQKFDELNHSHISEKSAQTLINYSNHGVSVPSPIEFEVMKVRYVHT